jgi:hypothetical protein
VEGNGLGLIKVQFRHLPAGIEQNYEKPLDSRSAGRDLNMGPPEYKAGVDNHATATFDVTCP